ncbi:MAG TPA: carbohydrate ABC transporter permease [Thermomicrobiales bacterium]|nr:carbohydrate ABC transporter permease [Thermomicrobiales bacterium]
MVQNRSALNRFLTGALPTLIFLILVLLPFYIMAIVSFKSLQQFTNLDDNPWIVTQFTLGHYIYLFKNTLFATWTLNSAIVSVVATVISLAFSILAGYALARLRFRGANALGWIIFVTYLVPQTLLFLPLTNVISIFHLTNTRWALILTYPTILIPFSTWLLMGYFRGIPRELEQAAMIDGATRLQAMWRVVLPLALPGILSAGIFAFTLSWNEYIYALTFINSAGLKTIPVGVTTELIRGDTNFWGPLMAGALLGSVPVALLYSFFVDYFVAGMTAGAVKG